MAKAKEGQQSTQPEQQQGPRRPGEQQSSRAMQTTSGQRGGGERQAGLTRHGQFAPSPWAAGSPFALMRRFSEEMDRLFFENFGFGRGFTAPSFGRGFGGEMGRSMWQPQVEVFERGGRLVVRADLPGMSKDDIDVEVQDDAVVIRGERREEHEEDEGGFYRSERSYGSFYREIPLPGGASAEGADATFRDGVLEVTMPAPERAPRGRRLVVREAAGGEEEQPRSRARASSGGQT